LTYKNKTKEHLFLGNFWRGGKGFVMCVALRSGNYSCKKIPIAIEAYPEKRAQTGRKLQPYHLSLVYVWTLNELYRQYKLTSKWGLILISVPLNSNLL
jgi:hypothetical protein